MQIEKNISLTYFIKVNESRCIALMAHLDFPFVSTMSSMWIVKPYQMLLFSNFWVEKLDANVCFQVILRLVEQITKK